MSKSLEILELGDLLNEFVDEYSLWHQASSEALKRGLWCTAYFHQEKIKPLVKGCQNIHYLNPIDRIVQLSFWLQGEISIHTVKSFSELVDNLHFARLQNLVLFESDEISFTFKQDNKILSVLTGTVDSHGVWFKNIGANRKIISSFKHKPKEGIPLQIGIQLTKSSNHRQIFEQQIVKSPNLFLERLVDKYINGPYSLNLSLDQVRNLNIHPKRVSTLFAMILNRKMLPLLKNPQERIIADVEDLESFNNIKNKITAIENNQLPFTS